MIRHLLLFSLNEDVADNVRERMLYNLARFPQEFSEICGWEMGANASNRDDTYDYGVTMTFARQEDLAAYLNSDEHERFVREEFRPIVSRRAIVSFESDPTK